MIIIVISILISSTLPLVFLFSLEKLYFTLIIVRLKAKLRKRDVLAIEAVVLEVGVVLLILDAAEMADWGLLLIVDFLKGDAWCV